MVTMQKFATDDGWVLFNNNPDHIYIERITSDRKGGGTRFFREIFRRSIEAGHDGKVELQAVWTSHIFHLKMGFLPKEREVPVVNVKYGIFGMINLKKIEDLFPRLKTALDQGQSLRKEDQRSVKGLKEILQNEKQDTYSEDQKITDEQLFVEKNFLIQIREATGSYIKLLFVPQLVDILETNCKKRLPNTESLASVNMYLSQKGIKRWKADIEGKKPFEPFRKFEQLQEFMTEAQRERIEKILNERLSDFLSCL